MEHDSIRNPEEIRRAGKSIFGREHGIEVYDLLKRGYGPEEIVERTDLDIKGVQRYLSDWRSENLVSIRDNSYEFTEKGDFFYKMVKYGDLGVSHGMERVNELLEERAE